VLNPSRSIVIDMLEALAREWQGEICVAFVYIRYSDQDHLTIQGALEVLVKQTVERHPDCMTLALRAYEPHFREGTQPTERELLELLRQFAHKRRATFYVLDALDEAPVRIRLALVQKLSSLPVRLFITSRPLPNIEAKFPGAHTFSILAHDQDLELHIAEKIEASEGLQDLMQRAGPGFKQRLISTVKAKCGGMYVANSVLASQQRTETHPTGSCMRPCNWTLCSNVLPSMMQCTPCPLSPEPS
jgi:ankyrin repeat domain-containing protein 50